MSKRHRDIRAEDLEWTTGENQYSTNVFFHMDEDDPTSPIVLLSQFEPGVTIPPHTHDTDYAEYIISGEITVGKNTFGPGDLRFAKAGTGYGPLVAGPEGCTVLIVFREGDKAAVVPMPRKK